MHDLPRHLLEEYAADAQRLGSHAEEAALLARSPAMREIFAYGASEGELSWEEIRSRVLNQDFRNLDPGWLAKLARVCALQDLGDDDAHFARAALRYANPLLPLTLASRRFHLLEIELLMEQREFEHAQDLLKKNHVLRRATQGYIACDLKNPFLRADASLYDAWIEEFNRPFAREKRLPVQLTEGTSRPFDRLSTDSPKDPHGTEPESPLVSVVMTTFRPTRLTLLTAVNSILAQTWQSLELIIVDDASPSEFQALLDEVEGLDDRIRVHRLPRNEGTYSARNVGMGLARGSLTTGQDSDDWSHPERIHAQVDYLEKNLDSPGVITSALRMDEDLVMTWRGRDPRRPCEVSLMVRREVADRVGGYMPARKAADSEYRLRVSASSSTPVGRLRLPLYLVRVSPSSLSSGDFLPGWMHPSRLSFRRAFTRWHEKSSSEQLHIDPETPVSELEVPIPDRFQIVRPEPVEVDVAYVADWRADEGVQRAALDELELLAAAGLRVGVVHIESWKYGRHGTGPFMLRLQDGLMERKWTQLRLDETAEVGLLVVRDPRTVQFLPADPCRLETQRLMLFMDESRGAGGMHAFDVESCTENARQLFRAEPLWAATRAGLPGLESARRLQRPVYEQTIPYVLSDVSWVNRPRRSSRGRPVIGRHARDLDRAWPVDPNTIELLWPPAGAEDVWIRGSANDALEVLDVSETPKSWVLFTQRDLPARAFLNAIDFYIATSTVEAPHEVREALEAIASGCIAILPDSFRPLLGEAAIYATPDQVPHLVQSLWRSPAFMNDHRRKAADTLRRELVHNAEFVRLIQSVLPIEASSEESGEFVAGNV